MCSKETIKKALIGIDITEEAISFLKNKENTEKMIDKVIKKILKNNDYYVTLLHNPNTLKAFKHSILGNKGHIKFIQEKLNKPKEANFQEHNEDAKKLKNINDAYKALYVELQKYIDSEIDKHPAVKDVLKATFKALEKIYN